eukprot:jgi/Mesvir1/18157/Mv09455-RA.1
MRTKRKILDAFHESGLSQRQFCKTSDPPIPISTFNRMLTEEAAIKAAADNPKLAGKKCPSRVRNPTTAKFPLVEKEVATEIREYRSKGYMVNRALVRVFTLYGDGLTYYGNPDPQDPYAKKYDNHWRMVVKYPKQHEQKRTERVKQTFVIADYGVAWCLVAM